MNNDRRTQKRKIGDIGEAIATKFLQRKGIQTIETNYLKKWGEIDIVAKKGDLIHFVEVKTVTCKTGEQINHSDAYRPEENIHPKKLQRLSRTIQSFLLEHNQENSDWQFDVCVVYVDVQNRKAKIRYIDDQVL